MKNLFILLTLFLLTSFVILKENLRTSYKLENTNFENDTFICDDVKLPPLDSIKHITYLDLYDPLFGNLPKDIGKLENLKVLTLTTNVAMTKIPSEIAELKNLEELNFTKAFKLKQLPPEICDLPKLKKLTVAWGGVLTAVPDSIGKLQELEVLDLGHNQLTTLPASIKELKKLKTLVLWANPISKTELARIKKMLPNTKIYFDNPLGY
jgi:Leucine-rich repeat (LRR) protein